MKNSSNAFPKNITKIAITAQQTSDFFAYKLSCETDCSDVYADIKAKSNSYVLLDVRAEDAFDKSHAITAVNLPHSNINEASFAHYDKATKFVVYCWGPACNGAAKAAFKISALGYEVKEMLGGIHYWEDFERYPVNRRVNEAQS
jgi:rhodanese-related sulfurtransferase